MVMKIGIVACLGFVLAIQVVMGNEEDASLIQTKKMDNAFQATSSWKTARGKDAFPGCNRKQGGKTVAQCQAYAEANNYEGFGRVLRDGNCCFKTQSADELLNNLRDNGGVDFYYQEAQAPAKPTKNWEVRNGRDAFPGCNHKQVGKTVEGCQAYAEANNYDGFGRVLRDGVCCFKTQTATELVNNLRNANGVDFYYRGFANPKKNWKVRKGKDAFPGCSRGRAGHTIQECEAHAEANNYEGFGRVLGDGKCCFKTQTANELLDNLRDDRNVDFYYVGKAPAPPPATVPPPPQQQCDKDKCFNAKNGKMKQDRCNDDRCAACSECGEGEETPKPDKCSDTCFSKRSGKLRKNQCKRNKCAGCSGC